MTAELIDIELDEISLVDKPANPGAKVKLFKRADDMQDKSTWKDKLKNLFKLHAEKKIEKEALTFDDTIENQEAARLAYEFMDKVDRYYWALKDSICSILSDAEAEDKSGMIKASVSQFKGALGDALSGLAKADDVQQEQEENTMTLEEVTKQLEAEKARADTAEAKLAEMSKASTADETDIDKAALPETVRKRLEDIEKQNKEQAELIAKLNDETITKQFIEKAATFNNLQINNVELGQILKEASSKLSADNYNNLETLLTACNKSMLAITAEFGKSSFNSGNSSLEKLETIAKDIAGKEGINYYVAFDKALKLNPELHEQYKKERQSSNQ
jgi:hypothetical protein